MSRTDKTRPYWVKAAEHFIEVHKHVNGVCDLPQGKPSIKEIGDRLSWSSTECHYESQWWRPEFRCGCKMCGWDGYGTPLRKRQRAEGKKQAREDRDSS